MHPKQIWGNFGVADLDRTTGFYTRLGFKANGGSAEHTSFLFGEHEFVLHFFLSDILATNLRGHLVEAQQSNEIIFTVSAETRAEVDAWSKEIVPAGGTLVSSPEEFGDGYYGFIFADPDGHRFNVFHMNSFNPTP